MVNRGRMEEQQRGSFEMHVLATGNGLPSGFGSACNIEAFVTNATGKTSEWKEMKACCY